MTDSLDTWLWRNPLPQGNSLDGVSWGDGTFVAVSRAGTIMTSNDGTSWNLQNVAVALLGVRYLNGIFVAVGNYGSILTSPDASVWTTQASGTSHALLDAAYGNGLFVTVGQCGSIALSADGTTWAAGDSGVVGREAEKLYGVAFGNSTFVVVGMNGTILTSIDGVSWVDRSLPSGEDLTAVCFGAGRFVAKRGNDLMTSVNGVTWVPAVAAPPRGYFVRADFVNGLFVAVGLKVVSDVYAGAIWTSPDGLAWSERTSGVDEILFGTAYGNGMFLIGGFHGTVLVSTDAMTWIRKTRDTSPMLNDIAYGNGTFVAVGFHRGDVYGRPRHTAIFRSSDLVTWAPIASGIEEPLYGVVYRETGQGLFAALGGYGSVLSSPDGVSWQRICQTTGSFLAVASHGDTLIGVGSFGTVMRSVDLLNWSRRNSGIGDTTLRSVTWGDNKFVVVGDNGTVMTSTDDGLSWSLINTGSTDSLRGIAFGNGRFVVVGCSGDVLTSPDGQAWTRQLPLPASARAYRVIFSALIPGGTGGFLACGSDGWMASSSDGMTWTFRTSGTCNSVMGVAYGNGSFVAVGDGATVLQAQISEPLHIRSLRPNLKSPQTMGRRITWTCVATARAGLQYAFSVARSGHRLPAPSRQRLHFQLQPRFTQTFDAPGSYVVTAYVRTPEGDMVHMNSTPFEVKAQSTHAEDTKDAEQRFPPLARR